MIYIGNQTACWAATPREPFDYAVSRGFDAFEWFPDKKPEGGWDENDLSETDREQIRATAAEHGIRLSVHARWQTNPLAPEAQPLLDLDLQLAKDLGAVLLNIHLFHEQGLDEFVEAIGPLLRLTAESGLQLAIENTPLHSPEVFNELFDRLRGLRGTEVGHVGMCLDLGHANLCAATRNDYIGFVKRLDAQVPIIHLHLHENWGDADTHLPLFTGPSGRDDLGIRLLLEQLKDRRFSGSIILEQWPRPPALLDEARDRLKAIWASLSPRAAGAAAKEPPVAGKTDGAKIPGQDFAERLATGDRQRRSWREKLNLVYDLLAGQAGEIGTGQLIDLAIYLRFLSTGEIPCSEDGRHFRPAHHARVASQIQEHLAGLTTPENAYLIRKIYPWLPSSAPSFQRPEPLTRIRDIAHRNDIGQDLKREIKTTLQNKLHRCAGPEDLATAAAILRRVTAPGAQYPPGFVEQFRIFHEELKEFFNARSLDERLQGLAERVDDRLGEKIRLFLHRKKARQGERLSAGTAMPAASADKRGSATMALAAEAAGGALAELGTLTDLRRGLMEQAARHPGAEGQEYRVADIGLEEFGFVLLSEIINELEPQRTERSWAQAAEALILALENLVLSGIEPSECGALGNELRAWNQSSPGSDREELLRTKATLTRAGRLAEDFSGRVLELFSGRVEKLGRSLGIPDEAIRVFSEAEIRGHVMFQVSKLVAAMLRQVRERLGSPPWDVLVTGRTIGRVEVVDSPENLGREVTESTVLVAKKAAGDEEIPRHIVGIVLGQEMPHLSHLGVRARQAGVIFVSCEAPVEFQRLESARGSLISLDATPESLTWTAAREADQEKQATVTDPSPQPSPTVPAARLDSGRLWIALEEAELESCGGKAAGLRRLREVANGRGAGFETPPGFVIPFEVMEEQLRQAAAHANTYGQLVARLDRLPSTEIETAAEWLRALVEALSVPEAILSETVRRFGQAARTVVRSSANCEDLEGLAGAGLYDSVLNVPATDVGRAVKRVWASLWTRRAVLSRRQAGIPQGKAHMAVIVQEMLAPDYSFVLHTVNPLSHSRQELYAELVVGLGDTLASAATRGTPYRWVCDRESSTITPLAFANFSQASRPDTAGGTRKETIDYSSVGLSRQKDLRTALGGKLARIGRRVEGALGGAQDIEGAVVGEKIYLVQSRHQVGLAAERKP